MVSVLRDSWLIVANGVLPVTATNGSVMTKSGLFKDERDTLVRRRRHRDRKLLLGGLGLTTGLGWSDRLVLPTFRPTCLF